MKLLIGGSPCTHWSIAQTKHRETEPSGLGWELFLNYLIAREKYRPDYFLYENNKSMSPAVQYSIFEGGDVFVCPFCCAELARTEAGIPRACPECGQPIERKKKP